MPRYIKKSVLCVAPERGLNPLSFQVDLLTRSKVSDSVDQVIFDSKEKKIRDQTG
jgi:hypothetical protein